MQVVLFSHCMCIHLWNTIFLLLSRFHYIRPWFGGKFLFTPRPFKESRGGFRTREMGLSMVHALFLTLFLLCLKTKAEDSSPTRKLAGACNLFRGKWVYDASYPLYDPSSCPFIDPQFNCQKHGRSDQLYQKYRWTPFSCPLPRYHLCFSHYSLNKILTFFLNTFACLR